MTQTESHEPSSNDHGQIDSEAAPSDARDEASHVGKAISTTSPGSTSLGSTSPGSTSPDTRSHGSASGVHESGAALKKFPITPTLRWLYQRRVSVLLLVILANLGPVWMVSVDVLNRIPVGRQIMTHIYHLTGVRFFMLDSIQGTMGVHPQSPMTLVAVALLGAAGLYGSAWVFLNPQSNWADYLSSRGEVETWPAHAAGVIAGLLTVGFAAFVLDFAGVWQQWAEPIRWLGDRRRSLGASPQFFFAMAIFIPAWHFWAWRFRVRLKNVDRYWQRVDIAYRLFVLSGILAVVAGLAQTKLSSLSGQFFVQGRFTALILSIAVLMWTSAVSVALLMVTERYERWRDTLCLSCGYDLTGTLQARHQNCPECGAAVPEAYRDRPEASASASAST